MASKIKKIKLVISSKTLKVKEVEKRVYKDKYGLYVKAGRNGMPNIFQNENGEWETDYNLSVEAHEHRKNNHDDKLNLVKE